VTSVNFLSIPTSLQKQLIPETIWGLGGPEEDHQLHHCCWTGRVSEREEEDKNNNVEDWRNGLLRMFFVNSSEHEHLQPSMLPNVDITTHH